MVPASYQLFYLLFFVLLPNVCSQWAVHTGVTISYIEWRQIRTEIPIAIHRNYIMINKNIKHSCTGCDFTWLLNLFSYFPLDSECMEYYSNPAFCSLKRILFLQILFRNLEEEWELSIPQKIEIVIVQKFYCNEIIWLG